MRKFREWFYAHETGVLGTVVVHLLVAILLVSIGIARVSASLGTEVELAAVPDKVVEQQREEMKKREEIRKRTTAAEVQAMLRSIATNENARRGADAQRKTQAYIDEVTEELAKEGYSGRYKPHHDEKYRADSLQHARDRKEQLLDSLKSTFYSGKSSVSYNLADRYARVLPIPVFKCEFGGTVVVRVAVDRRGRVQRAEVDVSQSQTDDCLYDVAEDAALRSRFNERPAAPEVQVGTITYHFVKQ